MRLDDISYNYLLRKKDHAYLLQIWINITSWGVQINFTDGLTIQFLCFYLAIDKEW